MEAIVTRSELIEYLSGCYSCMGERVTIFQRHPIAIKDLIIIRAIHPLTGNPDHSKNLRGTP